VIFNLLQASPRARLRARLSLGACAAALLTASHAVAAAAAPAPPAPKTETVSGVTVVAAPRIVPGAAVGDIKPDIQFQPEDIQAYGVSTITELLDELAPEIGSNSGRGGEGPAILVNGKRISGVNEIRNIPTEAILRVDILPEEAALKYGFTANQRVVNIVLRDHFGAKIADLQGGESTEGGGASGQAEAGMTRITGERRMNFDLKYNAQASLLESQRSLTSLAAGENFDFAGNVSAALPGGGQIDPALSALAGRPVTVAGVPAAGASRVLSLGDFLPSANTPNVTDVRPFRTLTSETRKVSANAVVTQPIFADIKATVNATFEATSSEAERGLPGISLQAPAGGPFSPFSAPVQVDRFVPGFGPLNQDSKGWTGHLGVSFNRDVAKWRLALTGNYDHADSTNQNDVGLDATALQAAVTAGTVNPFGALPANLLTLRPQDSGHSRSDGGNIQFVASGPIWTIPAGDIRTSFRVGATGNSFASEASRGGIGQSQTFTQGGGNVQASIDVPLTSAKNKVLPWFGDFTVNTHVGLQSVSGFGTLDTLGYGVHWTPIVGLSILVNRLHDQAAPSQQQTSGPLLLTPNTRIFDFATGQTVDVTQISGGNPALTSDDRYRDSIRVTYQPIADKQLIFRADYNRIHYKNPIVGALPAATAAIEAAFPDRFIRDAQGELTEVDFRAVNFASQEVSSVRWGFDFSTPIGPPAAPPPRNQIFQELRKAGIAGQVGRRPTRPTAGASAEGLPAPVPGAQGPFPATPATPRDGAAPPADAAVPTAPPAGRGAGFAARGGPGGGSGGFAGGRGGGRGGVRGGPQDGRFHISLFDTYYFADRFLVRPAGPLLDFLDGSSLGGAGGQPQQEIQLQVNVAERGYGAELNADWKSATAVTGVAGATGDLNFSSLFKVNGRLFADLNQRKTLIEQHPWLKGVRVSFSVANIFDQRQKVTDAAGATPLSFQPDYLDPLGRTWRIEVRKLFTGS
jgi:hypothetical protein